jgi:hypothetical protein
MPSFRDISHDGWLCTMKKGTFTVLYNSSWNFINSQLGSCCQGKRYGTEKAGYTTRPPSKKNTPAGSLSSSQPGLAAVLGQPSMGRTYFVYARSCLYWTAGKALRFSEFFFSLFFTKHIDLVLANFSQIFRFMAFF